MTKSSRINVQEENDFKKLFELILRNHNLFIICLVVSVSIAFLINRFSVPVYKVSASILIKENKNDQGGREVNNFLNSSLLGNIQNFQNELWIIKSSPVIDQVIKNLDLLVYYYRKDNLQYYDAYGMVPFKVSFQANHPQPLYVRFNVQIVGDESFIVYAEAKNVSFGNPETNEFMHGKEEWIFNYTGKFGELIQTPDLAFIIDKTDLNTFQIQDGKPLYAFEIGSIPSVRNDIKGKNGL
jgi:hypothetical protein